MKSVKATVMHLLYILREANYSFSSILLLPLFSLEKELIMNL